MTALFSGGAISGKLFNEALHKAQKSCERTASAQSQRTHLEKENRKKNQANLIKWDLKREGDIRAYSHMNVVNSAKIRLQTYIIMCFLHVFILKIKKKY